MPVDIKALKTSNKSFANINTSIGELYLFKIRIGEYIKIEKKIGAKLDELKSEDFFKKYLPLFAYLKQDLVGKKLERPKEYTLTIEEINQLTKNELEKIAKLFIDKHTFLYTNYKSGSSKKEDGTPILTFNKVIDKSLLKNVNESYINYVYRLILVKHEKDQEQAKKMFSSFSSGLSSDIIKTMGIGETLKNSLSATKNIIDKIEAIKSKNLFQTTMEQQVKISKYDFVKQITNQEKRRLAPFNDLSSKMDLLIETEEKTVSFMSDTYETQVQIASELKASSDITNNTSKLNIILTIIVIGLTVFSIWFSKDSKRLIDTNKNIDLSIQQTNQNINNLTNTLIIQNKIQNKKIDLLQKEIKVLKIKETRNGK